jgi:hypothetical protein
MNLVCKSITLIPDSGVKIPDGKAWIGDPCYVFPDNYWSNLCNLMFAPNSNIPTVNDKDGAEVAVEIDGKEYKFWIISTAFGDGVFNLTKDGVAINTELGVDAGLLSVIPLNVLDAWGGTEDHLGATVELKKAVLKANDGNFTLQSPTGEFQVITDGSDDVGEEYTGLA